MIEFLFWEGCPSHERALADLIALLDDFELEREHLRITEVHNQRDAERARFVGSPTIRVDDVDVVDPGDARFGLDCRVYYRADGRTSPTPDPDVVRAAVAKYAEEFKRESQPRKED